jgi:hypothetical protein
MVDDNHIAESPADRPPRRHSFILTLWLEEGQLPEGPAGWRCSLQEPESGLRHGFASLSALWRYLDQWSAATLAREEDKESR